MKGHTRAGDTKWDPEVQGHIFITLTKDGRVLLRYEDIVRPEDSMALTLIQALHIISDKVRDGKYSTTYIPEYRAIELETSFEAYKV